jgi:hypothetical protein
MLRGTYSTNNLTSMLSRSFMLDNFFFSASVSYFSGDSQLDICFMRKRGKERVLKYYVNDNYERILFLSHLSTSSDDGRIKSLKFISPIHRLMLQHLNFLTIKVRPVVFFIATIFLHAHKNNIKI